jgi:hypothetical protein
MLMYRFVRTLTVLSIAALLALAALVPAAAGSVERPFKGSVSGDAGVTEDAGCPIGLRTVGRGSGSATHLGLTTMTADHCTPNPPFGPAPGPMLGGSITFVAANGDAVEGTYTGTVGPIEPVEGSEIHAVTHVNLNGGTGRFEGATGHVEMTLEGVLHFASPMTATWTWDGVIAY